MPLEVTPRAIEVLRRALDVGRMDPGRVGVRISVVRGPRGDEVRTGFAEEPDPGEQIVEAGGVRLFADADLVVRGATIDVADEHDLLIVR
jgi:Fe-S cluster assembly iron-binding protein IscA